MNREAVPGFVIAAPASGSGKSMLSSGLMRAFSKNRSVQGFKIGPDYIDPMYHTAACGRPSFNLDPWMLNEAQNRELYAENTHNADLAIVEGVMGLFDGIGGDPLTGSSAGMAVCLGLPIILVVDCAKMSGSAGALVHGFDTWNPQVHIGGVICNRVASARHELLLRAALAPLHIPLLGFIPKKPELFVPERPLGLITAIERAAGTEQFLDTAETIVRACIDCEMLETIARTASPLRQDSSAILSLPHSDARPCRLAAARDEAFCFYYASNLMLLSAAGAEIVPFSPLHDRELPPDIQGIYFGGGYPELYARELSENQSMLEAVRRFAARGGLVFAECGGLVYLTESIRTDAGSYPLSGVLPGSCQMTECLNMGYRSISAMQPNWLLPIGKTIRSHVFHYSVWQPGTAVQALFRMQDAAGAEAGTDGICLGRVIASYNHIHFGQDPELATAFVSAMGEA